MKIRQGFVSNSSSSSFIVSYDPKIGEPKLYIEVDLEKLGTVIKSVKKLNDWLIDTYGWRERNTVEAILDSEEFDPEEYAELKAVLDSGRTLIVGVISNDYDSIGGYLYDHPWPEAPEHIEYIHTGY